MKPSSRKLEPGFDSLLISWEPPWFSSGNSLAPELWVIASQRASRADRELYEELVSWIKGERTGKSLRSSQVKRTPLLQTWERGTSHSRARALWSWLAKFAAGENPATTHRNQFGTAVVFIRQFSGALNHGLSESQNSYGVIGVPFTAQDEEGARSRTS